MTKREAIECLGDGHSFWNVEHAKGICEVLGLKLPDNLIKHYEGQQDANPDNNPKGLWLNEDKPIDGVPSLPLSNWVKGQYKLEVEEYFGRGSQARANAAAVAKHLNIETE